MVKKSGFGWLGYFTGLAAFWAPMEVALGDVVYQQSKSVEVLGTEMGAELTSATTVANQSATTVRVQSLGTVLQAFFALSNPPENSDGVTYTEVYSFGKRVFTDSRYFGIDSGAVHAGLAPTQIRVPMVAYPVGPLVVSVDGGVRFRADISAQNMTNISFPLKYSEPGVYLSANVGAAGFVEGSASLLVIRGGVGGQVDLVDAKMDVSTRFSLETKETLVSVSAIAEFLKGRIYAFLELGFSIFGGWRRLIDKDLYHWNGYCVATENLKCPADEK